MNVLARRARTLGWRARYYRTRAVLWLMDLGATPNSSPIFVLGNQKSGTTAIAALLAAALGERYSNDMSFSRGWTDMRDVYRGLVPIEDLVRRARSSFAAGVIKDPDFTFIYPSLAKHFTAARFVFIVRDPRDNIRSILNRLKIPGDLDALGPGDRQRLDTLAGWKLVFDPESLDLPQHQYVSVLSARWCRAVDLVLDVNERVTIVRYEDFVRDKWAFLSELATALGRPLKRDVRSILDRQFQPPGMRGIDPQQFFGFANLQKIEALCGPYMAKFGYQPALSPETATASCNTRADGGIAIELGGTDP